MPTSSDIYQQLIESFPFKTPRAEQIQAFEHLAPWVERLFIQEFENPLYFGIDAPTGVGKSPMAVALALGAKKLYEEEFGDTFDEETKTDNGQVWVVTANKLLQDQYQRDFSEHLYDLRGLSNYKCFKEPGVNCGEAKCGRIRGKGENATWPNACTFNCEYDKAKQKAKAAPVLSLNVAKALAMLKNPQQARPILMIYDEGHEVENSLDSESAMAIQPDDLQRLGLVFPKYFSDLTDVDSITEGLKALQADAIPLRQAEEDAPVEIRDIKRFRKLEALTTKLSETLAYMEAGIEYVSCSEEKLELKPLQVYKVFEKIFTFPTVFLSATLLSKRGFQSLTGIKDEYLDWFNCESPFPVENRPIKFHWRFGATPINYQNQQVQLPILVQRVDQILEAHAGEKGIIHSHTYKIAEKIYQDLFTKYGTRLLFPKTARDQKDMLEYHAKSKDTVLISPSMTQGVDLRDDLCRFVVMCKVPWLPTNDPVVKARMEMNPSWYTFRTALTAIQAPGRGVRSATDHAVTYLIDPGFARFFGMADEHMPKWFTESLIKRPSGRV